MRACLLTTSLALLIWGVYHTLGIGIAFAVLTVAVGMIVSLQERDADTIAQIIGSLAFSGKKSA
ncbi:MAG: hypothetical protein AAGA76_09175 [Pseudomonadota bacterium]